MTITTPSKTSLGYAFFDADAHYYEPRDCFTRHMESAYVDRAVRVEKDERGRDRILIGDEKFTYLTPLFEDAPAPGALRELMRGKKDGGERAHYPLQPGFHDRTARLQVMDDQGIEAAIMLPTLAMTVWHQMRHDIEGTFANVRAFNRWLEDDWGFAYDGRIFAAPFLSLLDVDLAVAELDRVLDAGARIIVMVPGPVDSRSPAHPDFDPFWARLNEAGVPCAFHVGEAGYNEMMSVHWGEVANPRSHKQSAFQWAMFFGDRPIQDTLASLIYADLFGRFPNLRVYSVENGTEWLAYFIKRLDKMKGMGRFGYWVGGEPPKGKPSDILRRHVCVNPFHEEDHAAVIKAVGVDAVLFGSDWPHPEGLAFANEYLDSLPGDLSTDSVRRIMRDNGRALLGLDR